METKLQKMKNEYVTEQANKIINEMTDRGVTADTLATCDYPNWDRKLHRHMNDIVTELRANGLNVSSSVNHGVTDWVFIIK